MKQIVVLILIAAAWYVAGMHRQGAIMAALMSAAVVMIASIVVSVILRHKVDADIPEQECIAYKDAETPCRIKIINRSRLPLNRFLLTFLLRYKGEKKYSLRRLYGSAASKNHNDENLAEFWFTAPYCGVLELTLRRIRVYDYLTMFRFSKKLKNHNYELYVYPYPKEMNIYIPEYGISGQEAKIQLTSDHKGDDYSEVRQVREYRDGDLMRHIHHNYTARTEKLWVKEYEKENDDIFDVLLDTSSERPLTPEQSDDFFELVCSVLTAVSKFDVIAVVYWFDAERKGLISHEVRNSEDVQKLLTEIYHSDYSCTPDVFSAAAGGTGSDGMIINNRLEWYFKGEPLFRFSHQNLVEELTKNEFDLGG